MSVRESGTQWKFDLSFVFTHCLMAHGYTRGAAREAASPLALRSAPFMPIVSASWDCKATGMFGNFVAWYPSTTTLGTSTVRRRALVFS